MATFKVFEFTHPYFTSDHCFRIESSGDNAAAIYGVADMIGHPSLLRRGYYIKRAEKDMKLDLQKKSSWTFDEMVVALRDMIIHQNGYFANFRKEPDPQPFGYCMCIAGAVGRRLRLFWLGDCRAYIVRRLPTDESEVAYEVQCMTEDHNALNQMLFEKKELEFFKSELHELSKHLDCFLGQRDDPMVRAILDIENVSVELQPNETILMMTDGLYLPLIRSLMDITNFKINRRGFYLEQWLADFFANYEAGQPKDAKDIWNGSINALIDASMAYVRRKPGYMDDIAVLALTPEAVTTTGAK